MTSASCSFYSYIPHFLSPSPSFIISLYIIVITVGVFIAEVLIPIQYTDTPEAALPQFTRGSSVRRMSNVTPNAGWSGTFSRNGNLDDNSLSTGSRQQENILKEEPKEEEGAMGESKGAKGPFGPEMITMHVPRGQLLSANR